MINFEAIKNFYPAQIRDNSLFQKYILKDYIQLMILEHLSATSFIRKIAFIGGTSIRLIKGIDRFSEDLDFDCKDFSEKDFYDMTDSVIRFLQRSGFELLVKDEKKDNVEAYRRNIHFPGLLYNLGLTGHREERFLIKIESQDQLAVYTPVMVNIKRCGFFFPMLVPPDGVLCAMKVAAMVNRQKGRDFYDAMFLLSQTMPDFTFLTNKSGITDLEALKKTAMELTSRIDMKTKMKDFEHLLFTRNNSRRILLANEFFNEL